MPRPTGPANNASASEDRDIRNILLKVRRLVAVLPALAGLGCYEYTDTTSAGLHPGEVVRVALLGPDGPTGTFTRWESQTIPW